MEYSKHAQQGKLNLMQAIKAKGFGFFLTTRFSQAFSLQQMQSALNSVLGEDYADWAICITLSLAGVEQA